MARATTTTSGELVLRCQQQERTAQAEFYKKYRQDVARTLYKVLGPDSDLEDALQDVFVEVFRSIDKFKGQSKITTWLYRVSVNVALQKLRRRKRRPEGYASAPKEELPDHETPMRALQRKESARLVYGILDTIAPKKRTVFILSEIFGMSAKEISEVVETNPLTVRTRLHYARKEFFKKALASDIPIALGAFDGDLAEPEA
ncbi:MAG: sigma-70 family RNA polymerase sigma factor [Myxococcales bacterium]|nr:sigma-70 family RNA polymerase sigma factor [Myxococcales bacterium]